MSRRRSSARSARCRGDASFRSWLFTIGGNLLKDEARRRGGRLVLPLGDRELPDRSDPHAEFTAGEAEERVRTGLGGLSRLQREVFLLRVQEGADYNDIAAALGTTPGAARVHYHHAAKRLKEEVASARARWTPDEQAHLAGCPDCGAEWELVLTAGRLGARAPGLPDPAALSPGVAADRDSAAHLTDALVELRGAYAQTFRDEHREISRFLDLVQRAQLYMLRERLLRRAHEVRGERHGRGWHHGRRRPTVMPRESI